MFQGQIRQETCPEEPNHTERLGLAKPKQFHCCQSEPAHLYKHGLILSHNKTTLLKERNFMRPDIWSGQRKTIKLMSIDLTDALTNVWSVPGFAFLQSGTYKIQVKAKSKLSLLNSAIPHHFLRDYSVTNSICSPEGQFFSLVGNYAFMHQIFYSISASDVFF